ncbi:glycosyltransferase [Pimelobacter simplex]|uniref:glycosyltransferase n=1 Tax=Nocardioides simplex TaxID=2045 RepID=UPI0008E1E4E8|nr:glycosyltransferase [Pimelobacter simplex]MCG8149071.1 glycosyltransferase [Pimelobacter simplex]GEB14877.1 hypothetical protein NSI01_31920 [Pimelobacter simplex]SFM24003.1 Glycosyltransferase, GT2 family [Pimelobacter simplex]
MRPRDIWTRLVIDPVTDPLARGLARHRAVTPNRVTAVAGVLGTAAAACLATGRLRTGGALFLLRFLADCLDGKIARLQGTSSARGALFDVATDVLCVSAAYAALAGWAVAHDRASPALAVAMLGALACYGWSLAQRKHLADAAGLGDGGSRLIDRTDLPLLDPWLRLCRRLDMSPVPWAVECETLVLGLLPLTGGPRFVVLGLGLGLAFYVVATLVNLRRMWRITALPPPKEPLVLPDVDVVIATHDRPVLVREAIAAVREQEYAGRVRTVLVFDRSEPDLTLASDDPLRPVDVVTNVRSPGLAGARNTGILAGIAPLVAFCDDDDLWLPGKLDRQVRALQSGGPPACVTGIEIAYDGTTTPRVPAPADLELRHLVRHRVMEAHPSTVVVRRDALLTRIGLVDEEIPGSYGEDFDWMIRAAGAGGFHLVAAPLVRVRWGGSQFSRQWATIVDAIDYGLAKHAVFHDDRRALARLQGRKAFALAALGRRDALRWAGRTARTWPREPRAYLAAAVALHLVSADRLLDLAHRRGHGI